MKNKKSIYLLLPLVLVIWGAVMYQFFSFSNEDNSNVVPQENMVLKPIVFKKQEPVKIDVNYRDPFLGKTTLKSSRSNSVRRGMLKPIKTIPKPVQTIVWPTILYKGIVSDTKGKNKVFMLIIDGQTFLMRTKNKENGVLLISGDRESIEVECKQETKIILIDE
jgi:hypothetical protein